MYIEQRSTVHTEKAHVTAGPAVLWLAAILSASACGGSSPGSGGSTTPTGPSSSTTFQGSIVSGGGQTGAVTVTIQTIVAAASVRPLAVSSATGSVHFVGGVTISLSGSYDSTTGAVNVSGSGFAFTGTISGGVLSGTFSGPNDSSGAFSSLNATTSTVAVYCGRYGPAFYAGPPANPPGGEVGIWNVQISTTGAASGAVVSTNVAGDLGALLTGQLSGSTLTLLAFDLVSHHTSTQTATVAGNTISGSCGGSCTLSASTSACQ
jgi:hypothetical protein